MLHVVVKGMVKHAPCLLPQPQAVGWGEVDVGKGGGSGGGGGRLVAGGGEEEEEGEGEEEEEGKGKEGGKVMGVLRLLLLLPSYSGWWGPAAAAAAAWRRSRGGHRAVRRQGEGRGVLGERRALLRHGLLFSPAGNVPCSPRPVLFCGVGDEKGWGNGGGGGSMSVKGQLGLSFKQALAMSSDVLGGGPDWVDPPTSGPWRDDKH